MRFRLLPALGTASLGLTAAILSISQAPPARAAGLVGPFAPDQWTLNRYTYDIINGFTLVDSLNSAQYSCGGVAGNPSCVDIVSPGDLTNPATFQVRGSVPSQIGAEGEGTLVEWSLVYSGLNPVTADFNFSFDTNDVPNAIQAYFNLDSGAYVFNPESPTADVLASADASLLESFQVNPGQTIRYGVYTASNTTGLQGDLTVSSFNITEQEPVPAPLPLLGAGAAFGWSRRLKRRIRSQAGVAVR